MPISDATLSIFSNTAVALSSLLAVIAYAMLIWQIRTKVSTASMLLAAGLMIGELGDVFRNGFWALAMFFATDSLYHPWFFEHRAESYLVALPLLMAGTWIVLYSLFENCRRRVNWSMSIATAIGLLAAIAYQLAQVGVWDRIGWVRSTLG